MEQLESYLGGRWVAGAPQNSPTLLVNPATEEGLAIASSEGLDLSGALTYARQEGAPALASMTFAERGEMLRAMSRVIHSNRDRLIEIAIKNGGNTRGDAKFDIDGASGTLAAYADLGQALGAQRALVDGDGIALGRSPRLFGVHVRLPRPGVAIHINAFNFPAWGLAEKAACTLLAGMPVFSKPGASTALLAHRIAQLFVELGALPKGAFSVLMGGPGDLLSHLQGGDVIAFTGSSKTARTLRALPQVIENNIPLNVEADSLNAALLGPDADLEGETARMFVRDVARDMTQKTGQKCTAIRRILVPRHLLGAIQERLVEILQQTQVGDPSLEAVTMGPLATKQQQADVGVGIEKLSAEARIVFGQAPFERLGVSPTQGYFVAPTLLLCDAPATARAVHELEVFGPVATLMPYSDAADAISLIARGGGGLVASIYSDDRAFCSALMYGCAPHHGRLFFGSEKIADQSPGPGAVLPQLIHGGPGRAGGGEELGGLRGLGLYTQRTALQGSRPILEGMLGVKLA